MFEAMLWIEFLSNSHETASRSMPQNPTDDKSTLAQVMGGATRQQAITSVNVTQIYVTISHDHATMA